MMRADLSGADLSGADLGDWERGPNGFASLVASEHPASPKAARVVLAEGAS